MTPDVVVDIGNSRIKFGRCNQGRVETMTSLPADDPAGWTEAADGWARPLTWAAAGVHPDRSRRFEAWVADRGETLVVIASHTQVPIRTAVDEPGRVGIDRLLNALAAKHRGPPGVPLVVVDVGSAVTIDHVDAGGMFQGGAILPGPWMMAQALHKFTAKLPLVDPWTDVPADPVGRNTSDAIRAGIQSAIKGAAEAAVWDVYSYADAAPAVYVTGGGMDFLRDMWRTLTLADLVYDETMTLEGIRLAAEALP